MTHLAPIILTAFGTTSRAIKTYGYLDSMVRSAFPGHPVEWAYTSRMVRSHLKKSQNIELNTPQKALEKMGDRGYSWAVIQSLHLICGHEFYRLVDDVKDCSVRSSMGLPLLSSQRDYKDVARAIIKAHPTADGTATVFIGHGTDHPSWTAYPALSNILKKHDSAMYVGTVEEGEAEQEAILSDILAKRFRKVHLVPLMLVAGVHVKEDISGEEDSWKSMLEFHGLEVSVESHGLGTCSNIADVFIRHTREALEMIPDQRN